MKKKIFAIALVALMAIPALASTASACYEGTAIPTGPLLYQHKGTSRCAVTAWRAAYCSVCGRQEPYIYCGLQYYHNAH